MTTERGWGDARGRAQGDSRSGGALRTGKSEGAPPPRRTREPPRKRPQKGGARSTREKRRGQHNKQTSPRRRQKRKRKRPKRAHKQQAANGRTRKGKGDGTEERERHTGGGQGGRRHRRTRTQRRKNRRQTNFITPRRSLAAQGWAAGREKACGRAAHEQGQERRSATRPHACAQGFSRPPYAASDRRIDLRSTEYGGGVGCAGWGGERRQ